MGDRLFRYDRRILSNSIRAALAPWPDRLIALMGLVMLVGGIRVSLVHRPAGVAIGAAIAAGGLVGVATGRSIASRLAYHASDGSLAADALLVSTHRRYMMAWHAVALAALAIVVLIARPSILVVSLPAYLAGAVAGAVARARVGGTGLGSGASERASTTRMSWRTFTTWGHRPIAGVVGAAILLASLALLAVPLGRDGIAAIAGIGAGILVATMTVVDHGVVRFLTITGHTSWGIIARQARGAGLFLVVASLACALVFDVLLAGIVAAVSATAVLVMTIRILAYRLQARRSADVLVSCIILLLVLVASSAPMALPLVVIAVIWPLQRRAAAATWLLA